MSLESRIVQMETRRNPSGDLQAKLDALARRCRRLLPNVASEINRQFMFKLTDAELLEIVGLGPCPSEEQLMAVAMSGVKRER